MSVKDKYNSNIRRGGEVRDMRESAKGVGFVLGTAGQGRSATAFVEWSDGEEETVRASDLKAV